jgi:hypothetical protein
MKKDDFIDLLNMLNISKEELLLIARKTGFVQRTRKIDSLDFLYSLVMESTKGIVSHNDIAVSIERDNGVSVSRQAIWKKVTENCVDYFKLILAIVIQNKIKKYNKGEQSMVGKFKRVLIQDSTIIKLPKCLFESFSGVSNAYSSVCNARIQGVYDLLSGRFISFSINPYSKNDISSATEMELQKDDLTLRDRGYLCVNELKRHLQCGAHCIFRYKMKMRFFDYNTNEPIDILSILKKRGSVDMIVRMNDRDRSAIRVVARPVDQKTADERRRKAKREMRGHQPGEKFLQLQSWTIFITTIAKEDADFNSLLDIYALRWRIEIIFKSWKSNLYFSSIHNVSLNQLLIIIMARMIMFIMILRVIYDPCKNLIYKHMNRDISLIKLTKYLTRNPIKLISILCELKAYSGFLGESISAVGRYCVYEKRNRKNFEQKLSRQFH